MFLDKLIERNPEFIKCAVSMHQDGKIPANSYVLDVDTIGKNAAILAEDGKRLGMKVFPMTKQIGRNPAANQVLAKAGLDAFVAVDMSGAYQIHDQGLHIGHLGHLVQTPRSEIDSAVSMRPYYWTVFSKEKAIEISKAAEKQGNQLALLVRIFDEGDIFYMGHEGGFPAKDILEIADYLDVLPNVHFAGITTFPALLFNQEKQQVEATHNLKTLETALAKLQKAGRSSIEVNMPGTTSHIVMDLLASAGATQVEPGHGLTGTTPPHALQDLAELPAVLYVSEISHIHAGQPYCFGGGLYIDPVFPDYDVKILIGSSAQQALEQKLSVTLPPANAIDYYGVVEEQKANTVHIGDTVIFGFRPQAFVTRAYVSAISGISIGQPKVEGVFTSDGREANWFKGGSFGE
ncbi:MAG: YhfX family PLP-dependent enzyme [Chloroflexi bacterium]|nr:YhfX family PLP-dependent enzyme [Chloroflexota bacterium]